MVLEFILGLFKGKGLSYSTINTLRSALSAIIRIENKTIGQHILVTRFLKAAFNERPAVLKTTVTWDVDQILAYLWTISPVKRISLKQLTMKLVMLMLLLTGVEVNSFIS